MSHEFHFSGRHLFLNFSGCSTNLDDTEQIKHDLIDAVEASQATIISLMEHRFTPQGVTILILLAESHAAVHTYPEHDACFLDIFTCGGNTHIERFAEVLEQRWQPRWITRKLEIRSDPTPLSIIQK